MTELFDKHQMTSRQNGSSEVEKVLAWSQKRRVVHAARSGPR